MHVELPSGLQNMQLLEYVGRGKELLPSKICSAEKLQFLPGGGGRGCMYCTYLD